MLSTTIAWIAIYFFSCLLTGYQLLAGVYLIHLDRLWAVVLAISFTFIIVRALKSIARTREDRAYQRWLESP